MNKTNLMKDLYKVLKESGWLDQATEHFRVHPEYFEKGKYGYIANMNLSVSFQPRTLREAPEVKPNVHIQMFNGDIWDDLSIYSNEMKKISSRVNSNGHLETITERYVDAI